MRSLARLSAVVLALIVLALAGLPGSAAAQAQGFRAPGGTNVVCRPGSTRFASPDIVAACTLADRAGFRAPGGANVICQRDREIAFFDTGAVQSCALSAQGGLVSFVNTARVSALCTDGPIVFARGGGMVTCTGGEPAPPSLPARARPGDGRRPQRRHARKGPPSGAARGGGGYDDGRRYRI